MKRVLILLFAVVFVFGAVIVPASDVTMAKKKVKAPVRVTGVSIILKKDVNLTVKWYKAKRATKYQVYMKAGKVKWKKVKTTTKRVYTVKGKYNTKYYFKVRGVRGKKLGKFSTVHSMRTHKKPVPIIVNPDKDEEKKEDVTPTKDEGKKEDVTPVKDEEKKEVKPEISLTSIKSHFDREYDDDGEKVIRKSTEITVKLSGVKDKTLTWYRVPAKDSYDKPEFQRESEKFKSDTGTAYFYMTEGKNEKYVYCSFIAKDGTEVKSEIFTVPAL